MRVKCNIIDCRSVGGGGSLEPVHACAAKAYPILDSNGSYHKNKAKLFKLST